MSKPRFCQLFHRMANSPAYRDLNPPARALLTEFQLIYLPSLNGRLSISTRNAAQQINITEKTARKAFNDLAEHGFIELISGHSWMDKKAREWRLTFEKTNNQSATDEWQKWTPGKVIFRLPKQPKKRLRKNNSRRSILPQTAVDSPPVL